MLDLSGSIVAGGALQKLKQAALAIVDGALPEQRLSLVSFADTSKVRLPFTKDKAALKAAINAIADKDGLSTNLYGAVSSALGQWNGGFVGARLTGRLTSGFVLVITDGADTAGSQTLQSVLQQRGSKRVITVGVGGEVDVDALKTLGNGGTSRAARSMRWSVRFRATSSPIPRAICLAASSRRARAPAARRARRTHVGKQASGTRPPRAMVK